MTAKELIDKLAQLPPDTHIDDDQGRSLVRVKNDGTLNFDHSEDGND